MTSGVPGKLRGSDPCDMEIWRTGRAIDLQEAQGAMPTAKEVLMKDAYGSTALHCGAEALPPSNIEVLCHMIKVAGTADVPNNVGSCPLHYGGSCNFKEATIEVIRCFVAHGADINRKNAKGITPLMYASMNMKNDECKELIRLGADVALKDNDGLSPCDFATRYGAKEAADILCHAPLSKETIAENLKDLKCPGCNLVWGGGEVPQTPRPNLELAKQLGVSLTNSDGSARASAAVFNEMTDMLKRLR